MARKSFSGAAPATTLSAPINNSVTNLPVVATTASWPNTATGPFVITIERGLTTEEKVLCASYTTTNIVATTRGYDGTTAQSHPSGASVNCTIDANTIDTHDAVIAGVGTSTPSTSAVGDSAVNGTALTTPAAGDHKHAREAFTTTTTTSAVGDVKNDGSSASPARADHLHGREAFGSPASNSAPGDVAANGTSTGPARSDHKHGRESSSPGTVLTAANISAPNYVNSTATFPVVNTIDATNAKLTFTAPANGKVVLSESGLWLAAGAGVRVFLLWCTSSVNDTGHLGPGAFSGELFVSTGNNNQYIAFRHYLTGLTGGNSYTLWLQWCTYSVSGAIGCGNAQQDLLLTAEATL